MNGKTTVIVGGGIGGLVAANELRRLLPEKHRVVLVEKDARHAFAPSFLWLMTGDRSPHQITRDLHSLVRPGVEVILEEVKAIDVAGGRIETASHRLPYDYLVLALGAELAPEAIPGLAEAGHTFYTLEGALRLRDALRTFAGSKVAVVVSAVPYKCPGAPHEGAMLIADFLRRRGLRGGTEVHLYSPEPQPMPVAGPELGEAVQEMLARQGVHFHPLHKLSEVDLASRELVFEAKEPFKYDLLVAVPPHRGSRLAREAGLANESGWLPVDPATLETRHENVFALGDMTAIPLPGRWKPDVPLMLPKAGVFAHAQAEVVARRIASEVMGAANPPEFPGVGYCMLEAGESLAGFAYGDFFAEPSPKIELRKMGSIWHSGKVLFEQWWLAPPGLRRDALRLALGLGGRLLDVPVVI